jgi:hypothetical protein
LGRYVSRFRKITGGQIVSMMNPLAGPAGPGKFSTRTDNLQMPSQFYGEGVETAAIKAGAPLAKTSDVTPSQAPNVPQNQTPLTGLYEKSQNPDQPITAGIDMGAGPGSAALAMSQPSGKLSDTLAVLLPYDTTGEITVLYQNALSRGQ